MCRSYPELRFLSRTTADGWTPPIDGLLTPPHALSTSTQHTDNPSACTGHDHDQQQTKAPVAVFLRCRDAKQAPHTPPHGHTPHVMRASHPAPGTYPARTRYAPNTQHLPSTHPAPAHTKRARTNRSGRATYSAQALGRLPWFAPFLRRSRRLRPRFDMSFSLGLLSRLKHFCTHWPKPPRHNASPATKVTENGRQPRPRQPA